MKTLRMTFLAAMLVALATLPACSGRSGFGSDTGDCDYLVFASVSDGGVVPIATLACENTPVPMDMTVEVVFRSPEDGLGEPPDATDLARFMLTHYDVTFRNLTTGGSVAGVDVPHPFRQTVGAIFDVSAEETVELTQFPVMLAGAKAVPPLNDDSYYPTAAGVVLEAKMVFWGHGVTDSNAWCYGVLTWNFTVVPC